MALVLGLTASVACGPDARRAGPRESPTGSTGPTGGGVTERAGTSPPPVAHVRVEDGALVEALDHLLVEGVGRPEVVGGRAGERDLDVVGRRVVLQEKSHVVIDRRKRRVDDLRRHEIREDLFHPHVVEPLHRHQIAEPQVRGLV